MQYSQRYLFFLATAAFLFLANLLVMNDVATIWDGAETHMLIRSLLGEERVLLFPDLLLGLIGDSGHLSEFWLRLPSMVALVLGMVIFFFLGRLVYGVNPTVHALLVMAASFLVPLLGKLATGDAWLLAAHLLGYQSLVLYLKQPVMRWRLWFYVLLALGVWIHPASTLVFLPGVAAIFYFLHPQGRRLMALNPWLAALLAGLVVYALGGMAGPRTGFALGFGEASFGRYVLMLVLGLLPFTGFWVAGLWDAFQKIRQGEELSQLTMAWLVTALVAQSPVAVAALAFLAGKQLVLYFDPRYPHRDIVRTLSVLHLIGLFFGITFLILGGAFQFEGVGFRAGLAFGAVYWMLSFVSVIGLFGMNRRFVIGGTVMSGLVAMLLFWIQLYPLWEGERGLPKRMTSLLKEETGKQIFLAIPPATGPDNLQLYLADGFPDLALLPDQEALDAALKKEPEGVFVISEAMADGLEAVSADTLRGWNDRLETEYFLLVKN